MFKKHSSEQALGRKIKSRARRPRGVKRGGRALSRGTVPNGEKVMTLNIVSCRLFHDDADEKG